MRERQCVLVSQKREGKRGRERERDRCKDRWAERGFEWVRERKRECLSRVWHGDGLMLDASKAIEGMRRKRRER